MSGKLFGTAKVFYA